MERINEIMFHNTKVLIILKNFFFVIFNCIFLQPIINLKKTYFLQKIVFLSVYNSIFQLLQNLVVILNIVILSLLSYPNQDYYPLLSKKL